MFKVDYILNAYISGQECQVPLKNGHNFVEEEEPEGAVALPINNSNANEQIQEVLNIFPHLTTAFVEKLLQCYETTEKAIAEYLEGNLPPDLIENEGCSSSDVLSVAKHTPSISPIPSTSNAAKDNEFLDQFNFADNSKVIVKMGKGFPGGHRNASSLLDDKSHIHSLRDRYEAYGIVVENENEYDDEYDDSYDGMTESESKSHRKAVNVIAKDFVVDEEDDDEEEDDQDPNDENYRDRSKDFCENPEVIRERLARNRYSKFVARSSTKPKPQGYFDLKLKS